MKTRILSIALAAFLAVPAGTALAQDNNLTPAVVEQLDMVNKLIALGDARKDPLLLLAAASLQKSMGAEGSTRPAQSTKPQDVLDRAKAMAGPRKEIAGLAEDLGATTSKGAAWRIDAVTGRSTYRY